MRTRRFSFVLNPSFLSRYSRRSAPFGFNGLGEIVYLRSYSRPTATGVPETWQQTVERVVTGTFRMLDRLAPQHSDFYQRHAERMFELIYDFKFVPPGRGLWAMGSPLTEGKHLYTALNNCAFVSTENMRDPVRPFAFLMDASMLGVGVGFDTKGAGKARVYGPEKAAGNMVVSIADTREGWVDSLCTLLSAYFRPGSPVISFDYSQIRPAGQRLLTFGGIASGPKPLIQLHESMRKLLDSTIGKPITSRVIVDIMNLIGRCVVAGNIRRTAEIAFGLPTDRDFMRLKDYSLYPDRAEFGWTSNNSLFADIGMDYAPAAENILKNGEPGFAWLSNMRKYGRMCDPPDNKDDLAMGGNPCLEQTLESYELCCLVEVFIARHSSLPEFLHTLKYAFLYAKIVTLGETHWPETNLVMARNRRIGCSLTGIAQFLGRHSLETLRIWCDAGYKALKDLDRQYSSLFAVPQSIKITSIKPSGTVSLLAGATPGMHFPHSRCYIRRMRVPKNDEALVALLRMRGYSLENDLTSSETLVVSVPVRLAKGVRTLKEVSLWEQVSLAAFLQRYWADNQVSCTATFKETEAAAITHVLDHFQYSLKGISLMPERPSLPYAQMPYEEIAEEEYRRMARKLRVPKEGRREKVRKGEDDRPNDFCDGCDNIVL